MKNNLHKLDSSLTEEIEERKHFDQSKRYTVENNECLLLLLCHKASLLFPHICIINLYLGR